MTRLATYWTHNLDIRPNLYRSLLGQPSSNFGGEVHVILNGMKLSGTSQMMSSPSFEARNMREDVSVSSSRSRKATNPRATPKYETTADGDVVVVEPSFDADDNDGRSPEGEAKTEEPGEGRSPPLRETPKSSRRGHSRNLSEHFFDATTISAGTGHDRSTGQHPRTHRAPPPTISPAVGQKHRRVFSGEVTNPPEAHRRINSIGNSTTVKRRSYGQERQHQRVDSLGLDVLTAAAEATREELAVAAGERTRDTRNPWDPPTNRRSPVELVTYDHSTGVPPPPPPPPRAHHRPYPPTAPPSGYYGGPLPYPQAPYPPSSFFPHPNSGYHRSVPPPASGTPPYPVQYSRGHDQYAKYPPSHAPLQQPTLAERPSVSREYSPASPYSESKTQDKRAGKELGAMTPPPPVTHHHWRGGTTQGVQTFVTAIGVNEGGRTLHASSRSHGASTPESADRGTPGGHHRKTSSLTSWVPMSVYMGPPGDSVDHPLKGGPEAGHHRSTSSSVSFLQGFEAGLESDATFLQHLQASAASASDLTPEPAREEAPSSSMKCIPVSTTQPEQANVDAKSKLAPGGTSKRVRRKCTVDGCPNRVVQGGLCISHGAKRKQCKHPGCTKNVKKAGLCSTHGPARKRCEADGCNKVAVQGGRCIAHGAKKKLCSIESCTKQAILGGMCKKHHDQNRDSAPTSRSAIAPPPGLSQPQCQVIEKRTTHPLHDAPKAKKAGKPGHTRGLSIFQEISADTVGNLLSSTAEAEPANNPNRPGHRHRSTFSRDFGSLY